MKLRVPRWLCAGTLAVVLGVIVIYALFAEPFNIQLKKQHMKNVYRAIRNMDLSSLGEEDEEALADYCGESMGVLILDENYECVYKLHFWGMGDRLDGAIKDHKDEFQESPTITDDRKDAMGLIRLRGIVHQDQNYYVYLRLDVRFMEGHIHQTTIYFGTVAGVLILIWCLVLFRKGNWESDTKDKKVSEVSQIQEESVQFAQMRENFIADVTHELKTPLAVISSQVELLEKMGDRIDRNYYFGSIHEEIEKMSDLIGNMLNLTLMDHQIDEMKLSRVNLTELMEYLTLKYDALFRQNGIRFQKNLAEDCYVQGNQMYLEQVLNNYIMNAFQHTDQGKRMSVCLQKEENYAFFAVFNEGSQVPNKNMEQIWSKFYSENAGDGASSNAGLGLYQVKKIMEHHHGTYGVKNRADGVEFFVRIPLEK